MASTAPCWVAGSSRCRATPRRRTRRSTWGEEINLTGPAEQKRRAIAGAYAPTIEALYKDPKVLAANPFFADLGRTLGGRGTSGGQDRLELRAALDPVLGSGARDVDGPRLCGRQPRGARRPAPPAPGPQRLVADRLCKDAARHKVPHFIGAVPC